MIKIENMVLENMVRETRTTLEKINSKNMKLEITLLLIIILTFLSCKNDNSKIEDNKSENLTISNSNIIQTDNNSEPLNSRKNIFELFNIIDLEENENLKIGLISISDIYTISDHKDSLAIPNGKNNLKYFKLNDTYRQRLLTKTNLSESDSVFIYDYSTNILLSYPIKKLNTVAYLNIYTDVKDCPCVQYLYMLGFEVPKRDLSGLGNYFDDALVYIGKENPFIKGQMKPIVWKKISSIEFPISKSNHKDALTSEKMGNTYVYKSDKYYYFINDYKVKLQEPGSNYENSNRHLMIIDIKTGKLVLERLFAENESTSPSILNFGISQPNNPDLTDIKSQWTGKLFKNQAEVVFGFESISFGCPNIIFIDPNKEDIYLNCDSRH